MKENLTVKNSWQNIGICTIYALENIDSKYLALYLYIVRMSFGFGLVTTDELSVQSICKELNISNKTVISHLKWLEENKFIKVKRGSHYRKNGGSYSNKYSPIYPKGYGKMFLKDEKTKKETKKEIFIENW